MVRRKPLTPETVDPYSIPYSARGARDGVGMDDWLLLYIARFGYETFLRVPDIQRAAKRWRKLYGDTVRLPNAQFHGWGGCFYGAKEVHAGYGKPSYFGRRGRILGRYRDMIIWTRAGIIISTKGLERAREILDAYSTRLSEKETFVRKERKHAVTV